MQKSLPKPECPPSADLPFGGILARYSSVRFNRMLVFAATGWPLGRGAGSWRSHVAPLVRDRKIRKTLSRPIPARGTRSALMATGKIKWFNDQKGFGFIADDHGGEDVFVHYSTVEMDGFKSLKEGQAVQYEAEKSSKGLKATKVVPA